MNLSVNMIFENTETHELFRVVAFAEEQNLTIVISITRINSLPFFQVTSDLIQELRNGIYQESIDTSINPDFSVCTEKQIDQCEEIWNIIGDFVENEPACFNPKIRSKFIQESAAKTQMSRTTIQRYLHGYWANAKSKSALIPKHYKKGGKGKSKTYKNENKRIGRPVLYPNDNHRLNITENDERNIRAIVNNYYNKDSKYSLTFAYERYIEKFYTENSNNGAPGTALKNQYPTRAQFDYRARKYISEENRFGSKIYNKDMRGITGSSISEAVGPGSKYQLDATSADVYLVSEMDRTQLIGRPVLYFISDVFSRMIVGFYVGVEGPSWTGAMMALYNTFSNKVDLCAKYGIEITESDWPCEGLPEQFMVDNGEMVSKASNSLINLLGIDILNASAWRPDLKGIIENDFHLLNISTKMLLPGAVYPDFTQRGGKDYRLDATLTIRGFSKIIINYILHYNSRPMNKMPNQDTDIFAAKIENTPLALWNWGIVSRTGRLRQVSNEKIILALMLKDNARVTERGIKFKNLYYSCSKAIEENWFSKSRMNGSWTCNIAYDLRNMDYIYLLLDIGQYEVCLRTAASSNNFSGWPSDDIYFCQNYVSYVRSQQTNKILQNKIDYKQKVEEIVNEEKAKLIDSKFSGKVNIKDTKLNRKNEKEEIRKKEQFILNPVDKSNLLVQDEPDDLDEEDFYTDYSNLIAFKQLEKNKKGRNR